MRDLLQRKWDRASRTYDASAQQVALAWELAQSPVVIPIPGASRPESVTASARAADLVLAPADLERLDASA